MAAGFDPESKYLLIVSHSGRGVFSTATWQQVARAEALAYPREGYAVGIGPIEGVLLPVVEKNYETGELRLSSPDGTLRLSYKDGVLTVKASKT